MTTCGFVVYAYVNYSLYSSDIFFQNISFMNIFSENETKKGDVCFCSFFCKFIPESQCKSSCTDLPLCLHYSKCKSVYPLFIEDWAFK